MRTRIPLCFAFFLPLAALGAGLPDNLGLGLKQLAESYQADQTEFRAALSSPQSVQADATNRVAVNIHLNGRERIENVRSALEGLGLEILRVDPSWRSGVISAWLPIPQATAAAQLTGVQSVMLAPPPRRRIGTVTAQSNVVERTQQVNTPNFFTPQGILGTGISVGIVSDSYDRKTPHASVGIAAGNLPGPGNPDGYSTPVAILDDSVPGTDEGRGMAEIVHDLAPAAKICFATAGNFQSDMASAIRNLRTNGAALCDIITDDIYFTDEPFFSDGPIAQAIDDVVTSNVLNGKQVVYFTAAGNEGNFAYQSDFRGVPSTTPKGSLNFAPVPSGYYAGGFHNFNASGGTRIAMTVKTDASGGPTVVLQWDDPFDAGAVTTDYNLLVFSSTGTYLGAQSGHDLNVGVGGTDEPIESTVNLSANTTYQFVIALGSSSPPTAKHLRLISVGGESLSGPDIVYNAPAIFGHPNAINANAVGAYNYSNNSDTIANYNSGALAPPPGPYHPALESFSSTGGNISIYFDNNGNRLLSPSVRQKPEFSACDGVDTSFFPGGSGNDPDNDSFPNFFGTSAAAPTAAAIGALMLQAAGGPGHLTNAQMRTAMQQTTFPHDLDPNVCTATTTNGVATVQLTATGNDTNDSANSPTFFTLTFNGNVGETLNQLVVDLTNTNLVFDEGANGFVFTVGANPNGVSVSHTLSPNKRVLTLTFGNTFHPGQTISFGIDRDFAAITAAGNSADYLAGADIVATIDSTTTLRGAFANQLGAGYTFADGFGLIDAQNAIASLGLTAPKSSSIAANVSTRAKTLADPNELIGGFIVTGVGEKNVIVRAIGPSLTASGVAGALADPILELRDSNGTQIALNDNWQDDSNQAAQIQAAGLAPSDPHESALAESLGAGGYTAIVRGVNSTTGVALVEAYDADSQPSPSQLANISTRALVQTGADVMIGGFIITGTQSTNVIVRAIGPSLTALGVAGALPDPTLEVHNGQGALIASNDNWQQDSLQATQIQATGVAPSNALESAIVLSLNAGGYTAIVSGAAGTTGIGLVEVFNLY